MTYHHLRMIVCTGLILFAAPLLGAQEDTGDFFDPVQEDPPETDRELPADPEAPPADPQDPPAPEDPGAPADPADPGAPTDPQQPVPPDATQPPVGQPGDPFLVVDPENPIDIEEILFRMGGGVSPGTWAPGPGSQPGEHDQMRSGPTEPGATTQPEDTTQPSETTQPGQTSQPPQGQVGGHESLTHAGSPSEGGTDEAAQIADSHGEEELGGNETANNEVGRNPTETDQREDQPEEPEQPDQPDDGGDIDDDELEEFARIQVEVLRVQESVQKEIQETYDEAELTDREIHEINQALDAAGGDIDQVGESPTFDEEHQEVLEEVAELEVEAHAAFDQVVEGSNLGEERFHEVAVAVSHDRELSAEVNQLVEEALQDNNEGAD